MIAENRRLLLVKALLVVDVIVAAAGVALYLPDVFAPAQLDPYGDTSQLTEARFTCALFALIAIFAAVSWSNRQIPRATLVGLLAIVTIGLLIGGTGVLIADVLRMASHGQLEWGGLLRNPAFWRYLLVPPLMVWWLVLHWRHLLRRRSNGSHATVAHS